MSSMPLSTANWHWKNKTITPWAKSWFEKELVTIEAKGEGEEIVSISEVTEVDGDVEVGQRKSKLITIYDCKVDLKWKGTASDGTEVSGRLQIPEVSHEITLDKLSNYVYEWSLTTDSSPPVNELYALAKARLPALLEAKFEEFPTVIIDTHGKDLQVSAAPSAEPSRTGTPAPVASSSAAAPKAGAPTVVKQEKKPLSTATVKLDATFMASADDLFQMLTDEGKLPMWTRAPAQSKPEPGGAFSLFGGGVKGTYISLDRPSKVVQNWALSSPTWPSDHSGVLTITFEQSTDSTKMTLSLTGVPTGIQDEIRGNMEGYYIQGLKSIGYVQLVYSEPSPSSHSASLRQPPTKKPGELAPAAGTSRTFVVVLAVLVLVGAFAIPLLQK